MMGPQAAPATAAWMLETPSLAARPAPTLEDIAWDHLALLKMLADISGQPGSFADQIARTSAALGAEVA